MLLFPWSGGVSARSGSPSPPPRPPADGLRAQDPAGCARTIGAILGPRLLPEMLCGSTTNFPDYRHPWACGDIAASLCCGKGAAGVLGPAGERQLPLGTGATRASRCPGPAVQDPGDVVVPPGGRELKGHPGPPTWRGVCKAGGGAPSPFSGSVSQTPHLQGFSRDSQFI